MPDGLPGDGGTGALDAAAGRLRLMCGLSPLSVQPMPSTCAPSRPLMSKPALTVRLVLAWADDHHKRKGKYPTAYAGPVLARRAVRPELAEDRQRPA